MGASDEAGSIDYRPTDTQMQVLASSKRISAAAKAGFEKLVLHATFRPSTSDGRQGPADWRNGNTVDV